MKKYVIPAMILLLSVFLFGLLVRSYFGVLEFPGVVPDRCSFPDNLSCNDFLIKTEPPSISILIKNNNEFDIDILNVVASGPGITGICIYPLDALPLQLKKSEEKLLTISPCAFSSPNKKYKYVINISYVPSGNLNNVDIKSIVGEIFAKKY